MTHNNNNINNNNNNSNNNIKIMLVKEPRRQSQSRGLGVSMFLPTILLNIINVNVILLHDAGVLLLEIITFVRHEDNN